MVVPRAATHARASPLDARHVPRLVHDRGPFIRGMRQRLSAVPATARSMSSSVSAFAIVSATGNIYSGLIYPLVFTGISIVAAIVFLPETRGRSLEEA